MLTNSLSTQAKTLETRAQDLILGSHPSKELQMLYKRFVGRDLFENATDCVATHNQIFQLQAKWFTTYEEAMTSLFWATHGSFGQEVVAVLKDVAGGAIPDITEDQEELRKIAAVQVEYLMMKLYQLEDPHNDEVIFTIEHLRGVVERLLGKELHTEKDQEFIEQYARFISSFSTRDQYHPDNRRLWLTNGSANMLDLARKFNKPLYWVFYGRFQKLLCRLTNGKIEQMKIIDTCLANLKTVVDVPDVKIVEAIMYLCKAALLAHPEDKPMFDENKKWLPPSKESVAVWDIAQECLKDVKGELLNADLHRKINLYLWSCIPGTAESFRVESRALASTMFHEINIHEVAVLSHHDEWWHEIFYHVICSIFWKSVALLKTTEELYEFLSKYPVRVAALVRSKDDQAPKLPKRKLNELPLQEDLAVMTNKKPKVEQEDKPIENDKENVIIPPCN